MRQTTLVPTLIKWHQPSSSSCKSVKIASFKTPIIREKVAAFDFDGTIACVDGSHTWPKNGQDWKW